MFAIYPAMLTSYMSVPNMDHPVKSVRDVYDLGYKMWVAKDSLLHFFLKYSPKGMQNARFPIT